MEPEVRTIADIDQLIKDGIGEDLHLEYKRSEALGKKSIDRNELSKDVSAFANADGGRIIYGVSEKDHKPEKRDDGVDPKEFSKEWIDQVLGSTISPRINGLIITPINADNGNLYYVIDIPKSSKAHQANDKKFYRRRNFMSDPMEQYEILDVLNRDIGPDLELHFELKIEEVRSSDKTREVKLSATLKNESETLAEHSVIRVFIDQRLGIIDNGIFSNSGEEQEVSIPPYTLKTHSIVKYLSSSDMPIWKGLAYALSPDIRVRVPRTPKGDSYIIGYTIGSPRMENKTRFLVIDAGSVDGNVKLSDPISDDSTLIQRLGL